MSDSYKKMRQYKSLPFLINLHKIKITNFMSLERQLPQLTEQLKLHQNMVHFRRYLEKCVRYFNFLPDHSAFSFTTIFQQLYLPHFAQ